MRSTKFMILLVLLIMLSLALASCADPGSDKSGEVETTPEDETGLDDGWMPGDDTPPYAYAQAMRERLDPIIDEVFGIVEVEYHHFDLVSVNAAGEGSYDVRYVLKNAPPHTEFLAYRIIHDTLDRVFNFVSFEDADGLEDYILRYGEEIPEMIGVALMFEGENYYWEVFYDGTYIGFYSL